MNHTWALDLGCGARPSPKAVGELVCGIDVSFEALAKAMGESPRPLVCGRGEQMPFRNGCFSLAVSDVAIPYMHIPSALKEIMRVLCPGGKLWLSIHPPGMTLRELFRAIRKANIRNTVYRLYILANGFCFLLTGQMFRFPLQRGRCESFQTPAGMRRAMLAYGFVNFRWERDGQQIVVTAEKPAAGATP
jgi:ubiquinone/menaquinone biosynthesis C-methylase UbiE